MPPPPAEPSKPILSASCHDVRYLAALLRGISFSNKSTIGLSKDGLMVSVEEARTVTGAAYVPRSIFDEYQYNEEELLSQGSQPRAYAVTFEIRLNTLLECLNIFGTAGSTSTTSTSKFKRRTNIGDDDSDGGDGQPNGPIDKYFSGNTKGTGMRMSYAGTGHPLTLILAESSSGPTATCEITTFDHDPDSDTDLELKNEEVILQIILKSSWLRDALSELDPSCEKLAFVGNPPTPGSNSSRHTSTPLFRIQAEGMFGSTEMDYPNDREVLETYMCKEPVKSTYRFSHISKTLRALQASIKTSLRIDTKGTLSLQFMMPSGKPDDDGILFVEFRCLSLDE